MAQGSEVLVEGDGVRAGSGGQARHDARLLVIAHPLLKEVGLAPAPQHNYSQHQPACTALHLVAA